MDHHSHGGDYRHDNQHPHSYSAHNQDLAPRAIATGPEKIIARAFSGHFHHPAL